MIGLFFDTETTGVKSWKDPGFIPRLVQLGAILQDLESRRVLAEINIYDKYLLYIQLPICRWIDKLKMTDQERKAIPSCETTGGYLKELEYKEAWQVWWSENPDNHDRFLKLPGFDAGIFKDITGIDVEQVSKPKTINIGGTEYEVTPELTKALSGLKEVR